MFGIPFYFPQSLNGLMTPLRAIFSRETNLVILQGNLPTRYGNSLFGIFYGRVEKVLFDRSLHKAVFEKEITNWIANNKEKIVKAVDEKKTRNILLPLPGRYISLREAINKEIISIVPKSDSKEKNIDTVSIKFIPPKPVNWTDVRVECKKEFIVSLCIAILNFSLNQALKTPGTIRTDIWLAKLFFCAIANAVVQTFSRDFAEKKIIGQAKVLWKMRLKIELFAEVMTTGLSIFLGDLRPAFLNLFINRTNKGPLAYLYRLWLNDKINCYSHTEALMELIKFGYRTACRMFAVYCFSNFILGSVLGAIFSTCFINIFFDQDID